MTAAFSPLVSLLYVLQWEQERARFTNRNPLLEFKSHSPVTKDAPCIFCDRKEQTEFGCFCFTFIKNTAVSSISEQTQSPAFLIQRSNSPITITGVVKQLLAAGLLG